MSIFSIKNTINNTIIYLLYFYFKGKLENFKDKSNDLYKLKLFLQYKIIHYL